MTIKEVYSEQDYIEQSVLSIETFLNAQLEKKKVLRVALSGGTSPKAVYEALAKRKKVDFSRIALFLVDERYVPLNSKESNFRMIKEVIADKVKNLRKFYRYNTRDEIATIVDQYQKLLDQFAGDEPLFDLVILGMGEDGHTASLFPHSPALEEKRRLVIHTQNPEGQDRMTLTFPAILNSEKIIFLIKGKNKKEAVYQLGHQGVTVDTIPATGVLGHPAVEIFYCDC